MARILRTGSKRPLRRLGQKLDQPAAKGEVAKKAETPEVQEALIREMRSRIGGNIACCGLSCFNGMGSVNSQEAVWALRATLRNTAGSSYALGTNYLILAVTDQQLKALPDQKKWLETAGFELLRSFPSTHSPSYNIHLYGAPPLKAGEIELIPLPPQPACLRAHYPGQVCQRPHTDGRI